MEYKNYIIKPNGFGRYDLSKTVIAKKKETGEEYEREESLSYAIPFESALKELLTLCTDEEEKASIRGYLVAYNENLKKVSILVKQMK